ncbi:MAG: energy-coupling factor ABC transporter substrate-binding protein [Thermoleophilia bacterium]
MKKVTFIVLLAVVALAVVPLIIQSGKAEFAGADGQAEAAITQIDPGYEPWFSSIWEPPSGEIESLLFALQAAIGAGLVFYALGYYVGRAKGRAQVTPDATDTSPPKATTTATAATES